MGPKKGRVMKNHGRSVVTSLLFAGAFALTSCGGGDSSSNAPPGGAVFAPGTNSPVTTTLSVGGPLLVRLGTDNLIQSDPPKFRKVFVAIVTDTNGLAVPGVTVTFALRSGTTANPGGYQKGQYVQPAPSPPAPGTPIPQVWTRSGVVNCANEDRNFNAILDAGDVDLNGNGLLEPPGVSDVNPTAVSDASGFATATISYPQNYATWTSVTLEASTTGSGSVPATATFILPGLASDYNNLAQDPPGRVSPFGALAGCNNTQ
jgi:hypothetical protein